MSTAEFVPIQPTIFLHRSTVYTCFCPLCSMLTLTFVEKKVVNVVDRVSGGFSGGLNVGLSLHRWASHFAAAGIVTCTCGSTRPSMRRWFHQNTDT